VELPLFERLAYDADGGRAEISKVKAEKLGLFSSVLGHVGDGNFHQMVMYDPGDATQRKAVGDCVHSMMTKALDMDGTVSVCIKNIMHSVNCVHG
jgi:FAD/FMN-containing dehydrogenase